MKYWLQSLSENAFDVFILVYLAFLFIGYHYLMRWFIKNEFKKHLKELDFFVHFKNELIKQFKELNNEQRNN